MITIKDYSYLVEEKWKKIYYDGYDLNYEISNLGRVRNTVTGHIRVLEESNTGYLRLSLRITSLKKTLHFQIHRLVAMAFIPIPKRHRKQGLTYKDLTVNHINGNRHDNVVLNLEWCTQSENVIHSIATGLRPTGVGSRKNKKKKEKVKNAPKKRNEWGAYVNYEPYTIYTEEQIRKACSMIENDYTNKEISNETKLPKYYVTAIRRGKVWKHVIKEYNLKMAPPRSSNKTIPASTTISSESTSKS